MSATWVRASPAITGPSTVREIVCTASKSPGEVIGKPASITSTPSRASCWAISSFSCVFSEIPGDCSPSRSVVSKISTRFGSSPVRHVTPIALELRFFSVLVSRLRAAANALFPPKGEEKKCKVEAECHARASVPGARRGPRGGARPARRPGAPGRLAPAPTRTSSARSRRRTWRAGSACGAASLVGRSAPTAAGAPSFAVDATVERFDLAAYLRLTVRAHRGVSSSPAGGRRAQHRTA